MSELIDIKQKVIIGPDGLPLTPTGLCPVTEEDRQQLQLSQGAPLEYDMDRLMALPPKDTFLFRFLVAALRTYYKKPTYELNHQEQDFGTCFPAGTPVLMSDGIEKPIDQIKSGESVISHTGQVRKVLRTGKRQYSGEMYSLKCRGWPFKLKMTAEHPVATVSCPRGIVTWTKAEDLNRKKRVLMPYFQGEQKLQVVDISDYTSKEDVVRVYKEPTLGIDFVRSKFGRNKLPRFIDVDERFCRLIGLYLAEGSCEDNRVTFTFAAEEELLALEVVETVAILFGLKSSNGIDKKRATVRRVRICDNTFAQFMSNFCPGHALTKRVPEVVFKTSKSAKLALIRGWLDGDGHIARRESRLTVMGISSSPGLNRDMHRLSLMCGIKPSSTIRKQAKHQNAPAMVLEYSGYEASGISGLDYFGRENDTRYYKRTDLGFACQISDISHEHADCEVFNLEVEEDHSYVANGIAVHNCVGQATKKACDILMALYAMIYGLKFPGRSSVAGAYTFSRVEVAGQPGRWEGSNGYWSAAGLIRFGILLLKDLGLDEEATDADEQLAMKWVASKQGVPSNFENKAENQMVQGTISPENVKHAAKLIQVGLPQFVGTTYLPTGKCDARGVSPCKRTRGGHEMCLDSVIWNGDEPAFFLQHQSWFTGWASGPKMVPDQPAEAVWISARDYGIQLQDGDANAIYGVNGLNYDL